jgi:hypothetical protein
MERNMKKHLLLAAALLTASGFAFGAGGYVVQGAQVKTVGNTSGNGPNFWIVTNGGTGPCINQGIYFNQASAGDVATFNRGYKLLLLAMTTGQKVNIYNYVDTSCTNAVEVELTSQ